MRQKVKLQPLITLNAATTQSNIDAIAVGNNRSGVVFADVSAFGGTTFTINIQTASHQPNLSENSGSVQYWKTIGTITVATAAGLFSGNITDLGEVIRWTIGAMTGTNSFELTVFFSDQT